MVAAAGRIIDRPNSCSGAALSIVIAVENFWKVQLVRRSATLFAFPSGINFLFLFLSAF